MTSILLAVAIVGGIGLISGVGLSLVDALMREPTDPRAQKLTEALPGYNCGACGYPGCAGYAEAIVNEGAPCDLCTPGKKAGVAQALAAIMGREAGAP